MVSWVDDKNVEDIVYQLSYNFSTSGLTYAVREDRFSFTKEEDV